MGFDDKDLVGLWGLVPLLVALAIIGVACLIRPLRERYRRAELGRLAEKLGLKFNPRGWDYVPDLRPSVELFQRGRDYRTRNVLTGMWRNVPLDVFDCVFDIEQDCKLTGRRTRTVVSLEWPVAFPRIAIGPDTPARGVLRPVAESDVEFESDEFNRQFRVQCQDRKFTYDLIDARTMELLLGVRDAMPDLKVQIAGERAFFFRERTLESELIRPLLDFAVDFDGLVPDYVKKDHART